MLLTESHAYVVNIGLGGFCHFEHEPTNSRHEHDFYEISIVTSGTGRFTHGGEDFQLQPNDVFVSDPRVLHEISSFETRDLVIFFVSFSIKPLANREIEGTADRVLSSFLAGHRLLARDASRLVPYTTLLANEARSRGLNQLAQSSLVTLFTLEAMECLTLESSNEQPVDAPVPNDVVRALEYIHANISQAISVRDVADHVHLSPRSLLRRFELHLGKGVKDIIQERRMLAAAHRLLMGYNVREVSESMGIHDPSQFTRAFRIAFGTTPKRFQATYVPGSLSRNTRMTTEIVDEPDTNS